jgi:hypothetical protein
MKTKRKANKIHYGIKAVEKAKVKAKHRKPAIWKKYINAIYVYTEKGKRIEFDERPW